jgi:hypothetical protein
LCDPEATVREEAVFCVVELIRDDERVSIATPSLVATLCGRLHDKSVEIAIHAAEGLGKAYSKHVVPRVLEAGVVGVGEHALRRHEQKRDGTTNTKSTKRDSGLSGWSPTSKLFASVPDELIKSYFNGLCPADAKKLRLVLCRIVDEELIGKKLVPKQRTLLLYHLFSRLPTQGQSAAKRLLCDQRALAQRHMTTAVQAIVESKDEHRRWLRAGGVEETGERISGGSSSSEAAASIEDDDDGSDMLDIPNDARELQLQEHHRQAKVAAETRALRALTRLENEFVVLSSQTAGREKKNVLGVLLDVKDQRILRNLSTLADPSSPRVDARGLVTDTLERLGSKSDVARAVKSVAPRMFMGTMGVDEVMELLDLIKDLFHTRCELVGWSEKPERLRETLVQLEEMFELLRCHVKTFPGLCSGEEVLARLPWFVSATKFCQSLILRQRKASQGQQTAAAGGGESSEVTSDDDASDRNSVSR